MAWGLLFMLTIVSQAQTLSGDSKQVSQRSKSQDRLHLVHADNWEFDQIEHPDAQRLSGNVEFEHDGMMLKCDSAVFFEASNSFEAYGHVHMQQGDTLTLTGKRLYYRGDDLMAEVREEVVMTHREQTLYTDSLNYDRLYQMAYFFEGGRLVDGESVLTSDWGEYHTDTRKSIFNYNVELKDPQFRMLSDTLYYDTATKWTQVSGPSNIYSGANRIYTELGYYNTATEQMDLYDRSTIYGRGSKMVGDSIFYDKQTGEMRAYRNIVYEDLENKYILEGEYCEYNELTGKGKAYDNALAKEYSNGVDTLFVHADTLKLFSYNLETDSVYRVLHGYFHARAYRTDVQAVSDSMVFNSQARMLSLYRDPIVWSDNRQIVGEEIHIYANDSTIDSVYVREQAILVEQLDSVHFNQVAGQLMRSYYENGEMKLNCVDGNVYVVNFPLENDSSIIYQNYTETTKLRMYMKDKKVKRIWAPASVGCFYVAGLAPKDRTRLSNFVWFDYIRPVDKNDLFVWRPKKRGTELKPSVRHVAPMQTLAKKTAEIKTSEESAEEQTQKDRFLGVEAQTGAAESVNQNIQSETFSTEAMSETVVEDSEEK